MSRDYSDHFSWTGWHDGATECEPPEPGKEWLTITEDGEEFAVIVLRTGSLDARQLDEERRIRVDRADLAVLALNTL